MKTHPGWCAPIQHWTKGQQKVNERCSLLAKDTHWANVAHAVSATEITAPVESIFSGTQHGQSHLVIIFRHNKRWRAPLWHRWPSPVEESLSIWQLRVMKKWKSTFGLFELVLFTSSASEWHFHLSSPLIGSSAHIPIGGSTSPHTHTRRIYLPTTQTHTLHICLYVLTALCIMTATALPSHLFAFSSNPPNVWGLSLNIKRSTGRKRCSSTVNENKPSKMVLQTLCSKAISVCPSFTPSRLQTLNTQGRRYNYRTSNKLLINTIDEKRLFFFQSCTHCCSEQHWTSEKCSFCIVFMHNSHRLSITSAFIHQ